MQACQPYVEHVLTPSRLCKHSDKEQVANAHRVHSLYLMFDPADDDLQDLPAAATFGALPWTVVQPSGAPSPACTSSPW